MNTLAPLRAFGQHRRRYRSPAHRGMRADIGSNSAYFTKTAGADVADASGWATFDGTNEIDVVGDSAVRLYQELITAEGFEGDRVVYSDIAQFDNACGHDITVALRSAGDPAGGAAISGLDGMRIELSLWDASGSTWSTPLVAHDGVVTTAASGSVVIADGTSVAMRLIVDTDRSSSTAGTLRWTAEATN